jgi:hypothetical protein
MRFLERFGTTQEISIKEKQGFFPAFPTLKRSLSPHKNHGAKIRKI